MTSTIEKANTGLQFRTDKKYYLLFIDYTTNIPYLSGNKYTNYKNNSDYFLIDKSTINNYVELKSNIKNLLNETFKKGATFRFNKIKLKNDIAQLKIPLKDDQTEVLNLEKILKRKRLETLEKNLKLKNLNSDERKETVNKLLNVLTLSEYKISENPKWQKGKIESAPDYKTGDLIDNDKTGKYEKIKINVILQLKSEKKNKKAIFVHVNSNIAPYVDMVLYNSSIKGGRDYFIIDLESKKMSKETEKKNIIKQIGLLLEKKLGNKHFYYKIKEGNNFNDYVIDNYSWNKKYFETRLMTGDIYDEGDNLKYDIHVNVYINRKNAGYSDKLRMNCRYHRSAIRNIVDELFNGNKIIKSDEVSEDDDSIDKMKITTENVQDVINSIIKGESRQALEDDKDAIEEGRKITKYNLPTSFPNYIHPKNKVRLFVMRDQLKLYNTYFVNKINQMSSKKKEELRNLKKQKEADILNQKEEQKRLQAKTRKQNKKFMEMARKMRNTRKRSRRKSNTSDVSSLPR